MNKKVIDGVIVGNIAWLYSCTKPPVIDASGFVIVIMWNLTPANKDFNVISQNVYWLIYHKVKTTYTGVAKFCQQNCI